MAETNWSAHNAVTNHANKAERVERQQAAQKADRHQTIADANRRV